MTEPLEIEPENTPVNPGTAASETAAPRTAWQELSDPEPATGNAPSGNPPSGNPPSGNAPSDVAQVHRRGLRVRTLVFGLLLGLVSLTVLVSELTGDRVDGGAIAIVALIGAGVILLAGAVGAAGRAEA
jgi:hypothetical protein